MNKGMDGISYNACPSCRVGLIGDQEVGELVCPSCGFVETDHTPDQGPEWKAIDPEEKAKLVRAGPPRTLSLHDYGLSTDIGYQAYSPTNGASSAEERNTAARYKKWQNRVRTSTSEERSLATVLSRITSIVNSMSLPRSVEEEAAYIYRNSVRMKIAKSKSINGMAAASVYLACRKCGLGRTIKEISGAVMIEELTLAKYYRLLLKEVEQNYVPPTSVAKYISKLTNIGKIDARVERWALSLAQKTNDSNIMSGKSPQGLAAAYLYISSVMLGEHLPQREIAEIAEVTEVTVRNRCRELLDNFIIKQRLMAAKEP